MGKTLLELIWSNILKWQNFLGSGVFAIVITYIFPPNTTISSNIAIPIIVLLIIIIFSLANAVYECFNSSKKILPSILYSGKREGESLRCLLEPSELFSQNCLVSFHFRDDDDYEVFIGIGKVETIRDKDNKIQIRLLKAIPPYEEIIKELEKNNPNTRERVQIKPNIPDQTDQ